MEGEIGLVELVETLRTELLVLQNEAGDKRLRFALDAVELELQVAVERDVKAGGKVKFWVVEAGAEGRLANTRTQTVKVKLRPRSGVGGEETLLRRPG